LIATGDTDLWGGEVNLRVRRLHRPGLSFVFLGGLRYLQLNDSLRIQETSTVATSNPAVRADILTRFDSFVSRNYFFGPQLGLEAEWIWHQFSCSIYGKIAVGMTQQDVSLLGFTQGQNFAGQPFAVVPTGFLVGPTNAGDYSQGRVGVLGELGFTFAYQLTPNWRVSVGYSRVMWNRVARAGGQIDRTLNPTQLTDTGIAGQLVGPIRPAFHLQETGFWAQGVNFTIEFRY
jgi:hypothetical protein